MAEKSKKSTEKTAPLSDKDIMTDTLMTLKSIVGLYNIYSVEASNEDLYDSVEQLRLETSEMQRAAFTTSFGLGYYNLEPEDNTKIKKVVTQFDNMRAQLKE